MPHVVNVQSIVGHYFSVLIFQAVVRVNNVVSRKWKNNVMDCELTCFQQIPGKNGNRCPAWLGNKFNGVLRPWSAFNVKGKKSSKLTYVLASKPPYLRTCTPAHWRPCRLTNWRNYVRKHRRECERVFTYVWAHTHVREINNVLSA